VWRFAKSTEGRMKCASETLASELAAVSGRRNPSMIAAAEHPGWPSTARSDDKPPQGNP